jgi:HK97 family phage major capsid protein
MDYQIQQMVDETKSAFNERIDQKTAELRARLDELEQKSVRRSYGDSSFDRTPGQQFVASDEFKSLMTNLHAGRRVGIETKAIISSLTTDANGSAGDLVVPYRDTIVGQPRRRLVVRDLLPVIPITSGSVEYAKVTGYTNSAATVSETAGDLKPQSELKIDKATASVTTIAHFVEAMRQILDDAPQLAGLIDSELRYGLAYVEELQLLNGAGTGSDLHGIYTQATALAANPMVVASPTRIDVIGAAILQQNTTNLPADGIVMNPADWTAMALTKNTDGDYILGNPQSTAEPRLWGLPVVLTPAMAADKFLVGCFQQGATLYDRMGARVEVSTEDSDNFRRNKVTVLAEERVALAVKNTLAFTKGDFSDAITDLTS